MEGQHSVLPGSNCNHHATAGKWWTSGGGKGKVVHSQRTGEAASPNAHPVGGDGLPDQGAGAPAHGDAIASESGGQPGEGGGPYGAGEHRIEGGRDVAASGSHAGVAGRGAGDEVLVGHTACPHGRHIYGGVAAGVVG